MSVTAGVTLFIMFTWFAALAVVVGLTELDEGETGRAVLDFVTAAALFGLAVLTTLTVAVL